jgi:hypothetical protein
MFVGPNLFGHECASVRINSDPQQAQVAVGASIAPGIRRQPEGLQMSVGPNLFGQESGLRRLSARVD